MNAVNIFSVIFYLWTEVDLPVLYLIFLYARLNYKRPNLRIGYIFTEGTLLARADTVRPGPSRRDSSVLFTNLSNWKWLPHSLLRNSRDKGRIAHIARAASLVPSIFIWPAAECVNSALGEIAPRRRPVPPRRQWPRPDHSSRAKLDGCHSPPPGRVSLLQGTMLNVVLINVPSAYFVTRNICIFYIVAKE